MTDNTQRQDEIEALAAIYNENFIVESETRVTIIVGDGVQLVIDLPSDYPSMSPPNFELSAPGLSGAQKMRISNRLQDIYVENLGEPVLFSWTEAVKEELEELSQEPAASDAQEAEAELEPTGEPDDAIAYDASAPEIFSGPSLTDRKSAFQAHLAKVTSKEQVDAVLRVLKSNNKIARATHNMVAYRIIEERQTDKGELRTIRHQDCVDDGETGAGIKLLHLLEILDARDVVVVITRWYGGIHLGSDRFRHICDLAKKILVEHGYGNKPGEKKKTAKR
uniref:RWD domain-containing protein n=1 Tax=Plectus sambesii TaxID=2011161 RepID=A0A914UHY8_9BILA